MKHASLFSGLGGFDLAAEWAGWENAFNCEIEPFCQTILKHHFPNAEQYGDITKTDFTKHRGEIDVISGGFPCQPFSQVGERRGTEDDRYLWAEMLRCIREVKPRFVLGENVGGLVTWNDGMVLEEVFSDLENEGYEVGAFIVPACAVNAPHRRDRIWIVAHAKGFGRAGGDSQSEIEKRTIREGFAGVHSEHSGRAGERIDTNPHGDRPQRGEDEKPTKGGNRGDYTERFYRFEHWEDLPEPAVHRSDDGIPRELDFRAVFGETTKPRKPFQVWNRWRQESTKALGNAIVPQVAYKFYKAFNLLNQ